MMKKRTRNPAGFTLVEIAIVLVIIGLLLGGVLKGQELIENSKVKNAIKDLDGISAAYYSYTDRFRRVPGDDGPIATLTARGGNWTVAGITAGDNDGVLEVTNAQAFTGGGEGQEFFQHLKAAGFLSGNPGDAGVTALPRNAFNGLIGVTNAGITGGTPVMPAGNKICMSQVPGKIARAIDTQLDDGQSNSGAIQATTGVVGANTAPGAAAASYLDQNQYTICRLM